MRLMLFSPVWVMNSEDVERMVRFEDSPSPYFFGSEIGGFRGFFVRLLFGTLGRF